MTFKKKMTSRRAGRPALRSSAAVAALVGAHRDEPTALRVDAWEGTDVMHGVLAHTSLEWNAVRHAC
jgi:hypothetical protein